MKITTIKLQKSTKERLDKLKKYPKESYEEVLQEVLHILNVCRANPEKARSSLVFIDKQNRKIKQKL